MHVRNGYLTVDSSCATKYFWKLFYDLAQIFTPLLAPYASKLVKMRQKNCKDVDYELLYEFFQKKNVLHELWDAKDAFSTYSSVHINESKVI